MRKTAVISDDTGEVIETVQDILYEKYKIKMNIPDVLSYVFCSVFRDPEKIADMIVQEIKVK